jgi:hypothetical protein
MLFRVECDNENFVDWDMNVLVAETVVAYKRTVIKINVIDESKREKFLIDKAGALGDFLEVYFLNTATPVTSVMVTNSNVPSLCVTDTVKGV